MLVRILFWLARLRTWLQVRLGLWRGRWRRGRIRAPAARLFGHFGGAAWNYGLYCPPGLRDEVPAPLVVLLHGCRQRALGFAQASGFTRAADRDRFRLLCPQQRRSANLWGCWNWFAPAAQGGAGELEVVRVMLDDAVRRVRVAEGACAAVGLSSGGALAALLAFHRADRIDAAVAVAAPPVLGPANLQDPRDVLRHGLRLPPSRVLRPGVRAAPLMVVQGAADAVVAPRCAEQLAQQALHAHARDGAPLQPSHSTPAPGLAQTDHLDGGALRVRTLRIDALGHVWPGGSGAHPYVEAGGARLTELVLQFLRDAGVLASGRAGRRGWRD